MFKAGLVAAATMSVALVNLLGTTLTISPSCNIGFLELELTLFSLVLNFLSVMLPFGLVLNNSILLIFALILVGPPA